MNDLEQVIGLLRDTVSSSVSKIWHSKTLLIFLDQTFNMHTQHMSLVNIIF